MVVIGYIDGNIEAVVAEKILIVKNMNTVRIERSGCIGYEIDLSNIKVIVIDGVTIYKVAGAT